MRSNLFNKLNSIWINKWNICLMFSRICVFSNRYLRANYKWEIIQSDSSNHLGCLFNNTAKMIKSVCVLLFAIGFVVRNRNFRTVAIGVHQGFCIFGTRTVFDRVKKMSVFKPSKHYEYIYINVLKINEEKNQLFIWCK